MTEEQKQTLLILLKAGQIKRRPYETFKELSDLEASSFIEQGLMTAPGTFKKCSAELRLELRSAMSRGFLPNGITSKDIQNLDQDDANSLYNYFCAVTGEGLKKYDRIEKDSSPATDKQLSLIKKLIQEKNLPAVATETLATMQNIHARKLIFKGLRTKTEKEAGGKND